MLSILIGYFSSKDQDFVISMGRHSEKINTTINCYLESLSSTNQITDTLDFAVFRNHVMFKSKIRLFLSLLDTYDQPAIFLKLNYFF